MHKERIGKTSRPIKIPTAARLANIALYYLSRFAASEASLRRVLQNRIRRAALRDAVFAADHAKHEQLRLDIETIIAKHRKTGALNDALYAESKTSSLRRAGKSRRVIQQKLKIKGIDSQIIDRALTAKDDDAGMDSETSDLKAAHILAKRKKLGPYRVGESDADRTRKDMAAMARAGFSLATVRKVLGATLEDIEDEDFF